jgi:hypothetical protein
MAYTFTPDDIALIAQTLGTEMKSVERSWYAQLNNSATRQSLAITIHNETVLDGGSPSDEHIVGSMITAQTQHGYFELHDCVGYVKIEPDEIIFVSMQGSHISSLVIGASCTCSQFANIHKSLLTSDFSALDPSVLMAAMQLSLTEQIVI